VFPNAESWLPERWLDCTKEELLRMEKGYWAFGSGSRQCLGRHVATIMVRFALAGIYTNFETSVVDDKEFGYDPRVPRGLGKKLMLRFVHVA
jgi:unspecific monooxygenase